MAGSGSRAAVGGPLPRAFDEEATRTLFAGVAAHAIVPLSTAASSAPGLMLLAPASVTGWPIAVGGSQSIADALVSCLLAAGGVIETGRRINCFDDLPPGPSVLLRHVYSRPRRHPGRTDPAASDAYASVGATAPGSADRLPAVRNRSRGGHRCRRAPRPSTSRRTTPRSPTRRAPSRAGSIRCGRGCWPGSRRGSTRHGRGCKPARRLGVLPRAQRVVARPGRGDDRRVGARCPGFRDVIVASQVTTAEEIGEHDANFVGGEHRSGPTPCGNSSHARLSANPFRPNPYATGVPGAYLCSSATAPVAASTA